MKILDLIRLESAFFNEQDPDAGTAAAAYAGSPAQQYQQASAERDRAWQDQAMARGGDWSMPASQISSMNPEQWDDFAAQEKYRRQQQKMQGQSDTELPPMSAPPPSPQAPGPSPLQQANPTVANPLNMSHLADFGTPEQRHAAHLALGGTEAGNLEMPSSVAQQLAAPAPYSATPEPAPPQGTYQPYHPGLYHQQGEAYEQEPQELTPGYGQQPQPGSADVGLTHAKPWYREEYIPMPSMAETFGTTSPQDQQQAHLDRLMLGRQWAIEGGRDVSQFDQQIAALLQNMPADTFNQYDPQQQQLAASKQVSMPTMAEMFRASKKKI